MAAILPVAESVVLGGIDGGLRSADVKAGRNTVLKQWSTWYEVLLVAGGAVAAMRRSHPDWWEPAVLGGLFALAQRGGAFVGHTAGFGTANPGYGGARGIGAPAMPAAALPPAQAYVRRTQPAGMLG